MDPPAGVRERTSQHGEARSQRVWPGQISLEHALDAMRSSDKLALPLNLIAAAEQEGRQDWLTTLQETIKGLKSAWSVHIGAFPAQRPDRLGRSRNASWPESCAQGAVAPSRGRWAAGLGRSCCRCVCTPPRRSTPRPPHSCSSDAGWARACRRDARPSRIRQTVASSVAAAACRSSVSLAGLDVCAR